MLDCVKAMDDFLSDEKYDSMEDTFYQIIRKAFEAGYAHGTRDCSSPCVITLVKSRNL